MNGQQLCGAAANVPNVRNRALAAIRSTADPNARDWWEAACALLAKAIAEAAFVAAVASSTSCSSDGWPPVRVIALSVALKEDVLISGGSVDG